MSRRTVAGLLALGLIAGLVAFGVSKPVDYVRLKPGPTINVLGKYGSKQIVEISGRKSYRDDGGLRMVTVYQTRPQDRLNLVDMLFGWVDPDVEMLPREVVYGKGQTNEQVQQQSAAQMTSSQDAATAAALTALGISYKSQVTVPVAGVTKGGAADGKLETGDVVLAVDGKTAQTTDGIVALIRDRKPGTTVTFTVERKGVEKKVTVTTRPDEKDPKQSRINVALGQAGIKATFPFKVTIRLSDSIGGPSAGMMFALTIYDLLTPGSMTGGKVIAGSGEITPEGIVGPIGGVGQKIVGAQRDGARLFLVAEENCAEAARAHYDSDKIRLVKVHTLSEAISDVEAWSKDPDASLPRCSR